MKTLKENFYKMNVLHLYFILLIFLTSSCVSTKKLNYFTGIQDVTLKNKYPTTEPIIQLNDLLSIIVSSSSPEASAPFNAPNESTNITSSATSSSNTLTIGYLVNQNGDIQFPVLGKIHAAGLNKSQLTNLLTQQITDRKLLIDPIVTIRHLNFRVSVLGEVARPGVFTTPNEKLSILEALSFAGDISIYGKKDNILLIRENDKGEKLIKRINLTTQEILSSPYYYLKSNDVIYVEASSNRVAKERSSQVIPILFSVLSFLIVTINTVKF
jgi:polysaccharide biosynthesis/export protein